MIEEMTFQKFQKRDGKIVNFDEAKIEAAVHKAYIAARGSNHSLVPSIVSEKVAEKVYGEDEAIWHINQVHDLVAMYLKEVGCDDVGVAYTEYRLKRDKARKEIKVKNTTKSKKSITDASLLLVEASDCYTTTWDRNEIEKTLETQTELDSDTREAIAKLVENKVIDSGLKTITTAFVRELINTVLHEGNYGCEVQDLTVYRISRDFVDNLMYDKVDENSNISNNNPEAVSMAISEVVLKEWALDTVFSDELKRAHLTGAIHLHDLGYPHRVYCSSHSIEYLKKYGLVGHDNLNTESAPAKSASVLTGHLNTYLASMQANYAGALGLGYVNIFYAPYLVGKTDKEMKQVAQELIFNGSQNAFSRGGQTLFLDFNIHSGVPSYLRDVPVIGPGGKYKATMNGHDALLEDRYEKEEDPNGNKLMSLWHGDLCVYKEVYTKHGYKVEYPYTDIKLMTYKDYEVESRRFCSALLKVWEEGDKNGNIFPFPKCDFHVDADTFLKEENHKLFSKACELSSVNGSTYFVFDRDAVTLSACCFSGDQDILIKGSAKVTKTKFKDFKDLDYEAYKRNLTIFHNGAWCKGKYIETDSTDVDFYKIKTTNNKEMVVTADHIFPTWGGDTVACQLDVEDYLQFNTLELDKLATQDLGLTFEQGFLIGLYLGDGSLDKSGRKHDVCFSLNERDYNIALPYLTKALEDWNISANICLNTPYNNVHPVRISSAELIDFIRVWIAGNHCYEKELDLNALVQSTEFREGIVHGYYTSDGGNSNRIYSTSKKLIDQMECVFTSLGMQTTIDVSDRTDEPVIIRGEQFKRNHPLYCIRWFNLKNRRAYPEHYKVHNNSVYFKIESIENLGTISDKAYCFEMDNTEEPYFTLPSGVITHNCRLRTTLDDKYALMHPELVSFCGFQNVTVNLPQAAYRAARKGNKSIEGFLEEIDNTMSLCVQAHLQKKDKIAQLLDKPGKPLYQIGKIAAHGKPFVELDKCTYIIGIIGLNDALNYMYGKEMHDDPEIMDKALKVVAHMYHKTQNYTKKHGLKFTLEETPAESAARRLAKTDLKFYPESAGVIKGGEDTEYYTNSIHLSADADVSLIERIREQAKFHSLIESGAITHAFVGEENPDPKTIETLVERVFLDTQSAQITISPEFTICDRCKKQSRGLEDTCVHCGSPEVKHLTRVVGYFSLIENWNKSKREGELNARHTGEYRVGT